MYLLACSEPENRKSIEINSREGLTILAAENPTKNIRLRAVKGEKSYFTHSRLVRKSQNEIFV